MNWKLVVVGGLVFYVVMFAIGLVTGPVIHNTLLKETYQANAGYWRPELNQDPPDMAALMPRWITIGLLTSFVLAALYGWVRPAFSGPGWKRGLAYGILVSVIYTTGYAGWSGVFNLPNEIWAWWTVDTFAGFVPGSVALGWVGGKLAP